MNTILQIIKTDPTLLDHIKPSFDELPETDHEDGKYRLRKYSKVRAEEPRNRGFWWIEQLDIHTFTQSEKYNKHQGGVTRTFDSIDEDVIHSNAMREMMCAFYDACSLPNRHVVDIHQMRAKCKGGGATQLAPEGWHQDGYDCLAITGVHRSNIAGGEILLATSKTEEPFMKAVVGAGTMVIIDDSVLWHNGRSIQPVDEKEPAWMDVFIFTARK
jgi:hypothetical protein